MADSKNNFNNKGGIRRKLHKQSKYFTIMLIPHSSGNTRSIRIPVTAFYVVISLFMAIIICISSFAIAAGHFRAVAETAHSDLEQSTEINSQLSQEKLELNNRLNTEKVQAEIATQQQQASFEERIQYYDEKAKELEQKLDSLNKAKDEIYNQLSMKSYLPEISPVASLGGTRTVFMGLEDIGDDLVLDLDTRFALLDDEVNEQLLYFDHLMGQMEYIRPYLDNYPTGWPALGPVTSEHAYRLNPFGGGRSEFHAGIDIGVSTGTNVMATGGGRVIYSGWYSSYGYTVEISHGFGLVTRYAHNSQLLVSVGDYVSRGDVIARSGSTGRSTGPHVHYEVLLNGVSQNPRNYME